MDTLSALKAFVRVSELGSFSSVATELRVAQPTISKWVAGLEREFGVTLIDRTTRAQRLTDAGERLLERARDIIAVYDHAKSQLSEDAPELSGRLRLSVPVVFGPRFCTAPIASFMAAHPGIECDMVFSDRYVDLVGERFDAAIRVGAPKDSMLKSRVVARTPRRLVASPAYLDEHGTPRDPSELSEHTCLLHQTENASQTWTFKRGGYTVKARASGAFRANNSEAVLNMARLGGGIALLAAWLVDDHIESGELVSLLDGNDGRSTWETSDAPIAVLMPPGRFVAPRVRALTEHLARHFAGDFSTRYAE